ncbi:MAG: type II secretion system F family protein [Kiritimatiellales bacterium]|nr:type II secretion system F family protein [Kiritimatiellales bacterium]
MPKFRYAAQDIKGVEKTGVVTAANEAAAITQIRSRGLFPSEVVEAEKGEKLRKAKAKPGEKTGATSMEIRMPAFLSTVKPKQLMIFTRQIATLIHAGLPLLRGLKVLERQEKNPALKRALNDINETIEGGSSFAEALSHHPRIFNKLYINMVKAGEVGGVLDVVLERLAEFMEKAQKIKNKVRSAMTYPIVVLIVASGIVTFLMVSIIPKFEQIFSEMLEGQSLPGLTLFVMGISDFLVNLFTKNLPILLGIVAAIVAFSLFTKKTRIGRSFADRFKLYVPLFGSLIRMSVLARFARTLGTLMESGVPVLQALSIVKETLENEVVARAVMDIHDNVKEGETMAAPIEGNKIFPPIFTSMVEVGEETGELPAMLTKVADMYEDEVDNIVAALSSIIEPLMIVMLALIVGTIVIALFLPMISIIGNLS